MKLGFGLYYHMLNEENFRFARQCGATHVTVHLTDYFHRPDHANKNSADNQPVGNADGWGIAGSNPHVWELEYLSNLKNRLAKHDLVLEAIENFDPADWYAILLDLPEKEKQLERIKQIIANVGNAGIPNFGYNFSIAGVSSRIIKPIARGNAPSVVMETVDETPIPNGMVWNMIYDETKIHTGVLQEISADQLWESVEWFLQHIIPVAKKYNVRLCAHPDDPPADRIRRQPRLVNKPHLYQRLLNTVPSHENALEMCLGTMQEMIIDETKNNAEKNLLHWVARYAKQNAIGYIHFRNVKGKVPHYQETFVDDGDIDMREVIKVLRMYNFNGMLIPDHTPQMSCTAPWHAGMAYTMGYMKALLEEKEK